MEQKQTNSPEEIDLLYFFRPVSNAFRNLVAAIRRYVMILAINRYLFAGILLAGAIAGYCLRYVISPSYKTEALFTSDGIPANYCVRLVNNLNELRRPGNIPILSQQLNIPEEAAWQIQGIVASYTPRDTFIIERRDSSTYIFSITLVMADMKHIEAIQNGLKNYLENNDFVRIGSEFMKMRRLRRTAICDVESQISQLQRLLSTRNALALQFVR